MALHLDVNLLCLFGVVTGNHYYKEQKYSSEQLHQNKY